MYYHKHFIEVIAIKIINLKVNLSKILIFISILIATLFIFATIFKLMHLNQNDDTIIMTNENFTYILNDCHNNIEKYSGKKISFSGYIFRASDFSKTQFVTARDMLISNSEFRIVGFLCNYKNAKKFENDVWVTVEGVVTKGDYNGEMPIIKVTNIKKITTPNDVFVYPPK